MCQCQIHRGQQLESNAVLLVNVPVSLQLSAILDNHYDTEEHQDVDADNAECSREDEVEIDVGEGRKSAHAAWHCRSSRRVGADAVSLEHWRCAVQVSTAIKLDCC